MKTRFEVIFLEEARLFLLSKEGKTRAKIIYNIDRSQYYSDFKLLKKLSGEIWEFRTLYNKTYYRLFAFWDKREKTKTLIITTHGIIKKSNTIAPKELKKAEFLRQVYFEQK